MKPSSAHLENNFFTPSVWVVFAAAAIIVALEAFLFLFPLAAEFPMDDAYIHFTYAENLIAHGRFFFSDMEEKGVGVTSPFWVLLLAGFNMLGAPMAVTAKIMGALGLICVSAALYALLRPVWRSPFLLLAVFLVSISGNLIWFSLSGMETSLFLALGLSVLIAYRQEKWILLGLLGAALVLIRPEGAILLLSIGVIDVLAHRRLRIGLLTAAAACIVIASPWFTYLYLRAGHILPTSAIGKQFTFSVGLEYVGSQNDTLSWLLRLRPLAYPVAWLIYFFLFAMGGKSLPGPYLMENSGALGLDSYSPSIWAVFGWLLVIVPLILSGLRMIRKKRVWKAWLDDPASQAVLAFMLWAFLHNIAYMFFMPVLGTASRYGALNHILLWLLLAGGLSRYRQKPLAVMTVGLLSIAFANMLYWNRVYDSNLDHTHQVRIAAADFLRESIPAEALCAAFDIGAIHYFSKRQIVDIGGLTDPDVKQWFDEKKADLYLIENQATCLILPGQANSANEGWLDFVKIMGLNDSPYLTVEQDVVFDMDHDRWVFGYLPTNNQQKSVVFYKIKRTDLALPPEDATLRPQP